MPKKIDYTPDSDEYESVSVDLAATVTDHPWRVKQSVHSCEPISSECKYGTRCRPVPVCSVDGSRDWRSECSYRALSQTVGAFEQNHLVSFVSGILCLRLRLVSRSLMTVHS
jgi:hypothetical protein